MAKWITGAPARGPRSRGGCRARHSGDNRLRRDSRPNCRRAAPFAPGADLGVQAANDRPDQPAHHRVPGPGVAVHQRLCEAIVAARSALHGVGGQGERRAGKANQRQRLGQSGAGSPDRFHHALQRLDALQLDEAVNVGGGADRTAELRPSPRGKGQVKPHRLEDQQQVGEDDRRIHAQPLDRRQHDLGAEVGPFAQLQKAHAAAHGAILGQVTARLPHQPNRRPRNRLAPGRFHHRAVVPGGKG